MSLQSDPKAKQLTDSAPIESEALFQQRLAALDQTIVATALKAIVTDFGKQDLVPWIGSAFLLTAAPLGTLYGKFADIFGRKLVFIFAIAVFELGSLLCGVATSMEFLIVGRAIAGVGGGGIFALVLIIISDIVSIQDRGKYQGAIGAIFGLSSVIAPLVGGAFSDHVSWRWCFYINLPLGAITLATVIFYLNFPPLNRIDTAGAVLLFACIIFISMFILSVLLGAAFVYVEMKVAKEPIIPPGIFINSSVPALLGVGFQVVFQESATSAGLELIPLVFGLVITSMSSGLIASKYGRYRPFFFIGPIIMIAGTVLNSGIVTATSVPIEMIAIATALIQTANTLGGAMGVAITGTIFNNMVLQLFIQQLNARGIPAQTSEVLQLLGIMESAVNFYPKNDAAAAAVYNATLATAQSQLVTGFNGAFKTAYLCALPYPVIILGLAFFIKQYQMKAGGPGASH
ncbi:major facilitator superfamily domain-containing protein [Obelidium mucronatum]|nr:major facilitator superfamily domain-containing protein [Obelidium mucronatum]